jgi:anthraniloyl-CoA monooxygenase
LSRNERAAMQVAVIGGGPGGLYLSVLLMEADPRRHVVVYERNRPDDTFGFGVVFSDNTMAFISDKDQRVYPEVIRHGIRWEPIAVRHGGRSIECGGIGFSAIERKLLLQLLQEKARQRGVELRFEAEVPELGELAEENDLVVGADGVNSTIRAELAERFQPSIVQGTSRFTWLGITHRYPSFTFFFARDEHGAWGAHIYPYRDDRSTFIVETDAETWRRAGAEAWSEADTIGHAERIFAGNLDGGRLLANRSLWSGFRTIRNRRWFQDNVVLLGDAAHTAHFSVGSGTKMAMEDALALADALTRYPSVAEALPAYVAERRPRVEHIQRVAAVSQDWWETFRFYLDWPVERLAFHMLTRAQFRFDTLRDRDAGFLAAVESAANGEARRVVGSVRPAYRGDYSGFPGPPHYEALVAAAQDGEPEAVLSELLAVTPEGRISPADLGLWDDAQAEAWQGLLRSVERPVIARLGHAGPRAAMKPRLHAVDTPLTDGWERLAPPLSRPVEERVRDAFAAAAARAIEAGFAGVELHFGHGYLLAAHISPLSNPASFEERARFPIEVLRAVRAVVLRDRRLLVAYSATDWASGGLSAGEAIELARRFMANGADMLEVLGGHTTKAARPPYGPVYQMLIAGKVRNEAPAPVLAAGGVGDLDDVRTVLLSGRADAVALDAVRLGPLGR